MLKSANDGFTLIELVIVIVIISVSVAGLTSLFSTSTNSLATNEAIQQAAQYAQQCAEQIVTIRRSNATTGFASITNTSCDGLAAPSGFTRSVNSSISNGTGSPCPVGTSNCKTVLITVSQGAISASTTVVLVK